MYFAQNSINKQLQLSGYVWFMVFNDSFSYIVHVVSFIGGRNRSTRENH